MTAVESPSLATRLNVAASAMAIPPMPNSTPWREVSCVERPARLRMNSSDATMYAAVAMLWAVIISLSRTC